MIAFRQPWEAEIVARTQETPSIYTLHVRLVDSAARAAYRFQPGQFNMLYLYGVGEIPISIVSDQQDGQVIVHTIRAVGRVTEAMAALRAGDRLGLRGPYGRGWPMAESEGGDVVIVTGGLGCAPVVSAINDILKHRERYGRLIIMQGVKHVDDLIWREQYEAWSALADTRVLLAADEGGPSWPWHVGHVPMLFDKANLVPARSTVMMCGPEGMMIAAGKDLLGRGIAPQRLWLSMERNMQCGTGKCGHCQMGSHFVCRDGPVFCWPVIADVLGIRGI